jgi:hypothetical protein
MGRAKLEGIDLAGVSSMRAREAAWVAGHYVGGETRGLKVKSQKSNPRFPQKAREMGHPAGGEGSRLQRLRNSSI